jgi:hypothetical protein
MCKYYITAHTRNKIVTSLTLIPDLNYKFLISNIYV